MTGQNVGVVVHGAQDVRVEPRQLPVAGAGEAVVSVHYGGICGSDVSYVKRGSVGESVVREPLLLGHEVSGVVLHLGPGAPAGTPTPGTAVTVHPASPDGSCPECLDGRANQCRAVRYLGSAAMLPHTQGGFVEHLLVRSDQLVALPAGLSIRRAALAEPLAVAVHGVRRAAVALGVAARTSDPAARVSRRPLAGRRVLVVGAGPIGSLAVATAAAAGAQPPTVTDLAERPLTVALAVGAGATVAVAGLQPVEAAAAARRAAGMTDPGDGFDVVIESSGSAAGLGTGLHAARRGGVVVMLGLLPPGDVATPLTLVATRELTVTGSFRFDDEIDEAVELLAAGLPVGRVITHERPIAQAAEAFALAADAAVSTKVLLATSAAPPATARLVVVVGLMGAGKTTLARALAELLDRPLRDSDLDIEQEQGRGAAAIAEELGADGLHALEADHLRRALHGEPAVVAAAGWVVEDAASRAALGNALVLFIDGDPAVLAQRFSSRPDRPVYGDPMEVLRAQYDRRRGLFLGVADAVIPLSSPAVQLSAAAEVLRAHGITRRPAQA